jgi:Na+-transporting methylmalonyl-CoA/oxaloacetate decarboxylase gamma subunit
MSQSEAWIVTALGMTVVYIGLLMCVAFIQLFSRIAQRIEWGGGGHGEAAHGPAPTAAAAEHAAAGAPSEPIPADILAVIATAIEVERKLYVSRPDARLGARRPATQS